MIRKCGYRRCDNDISHMRDNAKFCSTKCKSCESTYKKRHNKFLEEIIRNEKAKIEAFKRFKESIGQEVYKREDNVLNQK